MSVQTLRISALAAVSFVALTSAALSQTPVLKPSSTLTVTIDGAVGPLLSGVDLGNLNGKSVAATLMLSESISPKSVTATSATYKIPAGAVTIVFGSKSYSNSSPGKMQVKLTNAGDVITMTYAFLNNGLPVTAIQTTTLKKGSWTTAVLSHPGSFSPSPQTLNAAVTASGKGSKLQYTVEGFTAVLGISGTATSGSAPDAVLPDDASE